MKLRKDVEKALRQGDAVERLRALGPGVVEVLVTLALTREAEAPHRDAEAAGRALRALAPDLDLGPLVDRALRRRDFAAGELAIGYGPRAVEAILARYADVADGHGRFVARVLLSEAGVRDERVLDALIAGLDEGDPPHLLAAYGDVRGAPAIAAALRASPVRPVMADAELERQLDLLDALRRLLGELPPDLAGRIAVVQALAARNLQDELYGQFEGKPGLLQAITPLAQGLARPSDGDGVDGGRRRG